ncbi:hypothetical protein [Pseudomarimonas arenosa]|uniref:Glycerophosphoryl diester phosphodiesterase membrane domain-containing protein n=1 Tax=Pseudomarimonas arenosa TaxID=2774145 RepID=A0AAW3ZSY0_9GAMM|nr:hypothetical protein [Pseudomarimonas arenosa]MBD8528122.1 hypothetical protein [Pseudomarimonas arenosa]
MISEPFFPDQPSEVGPLIERSFRLWRRAWSSCFLPLLLPAMLALLPGLLFSATRIAPTAGFQVDSEVMARPSYWLLWALIFVVSVGGQLLAVLRLQQRATAQPQSIRQNLEQVLRRLPAATGAYLIYFLFLAVCLAPWIAHLVWLIGQPFSADALGLFLLSTVLLWIIPTWFSLAGVFFLFAAGLEGCAALASLRRSLALIRRHWWHTSAVIGVVLLAYTGILLVALPLIMSLAMGVSYFRHGPEALLNLQWLTGFELMFAPIHAISLSLILATGLVCYHDLIAREHR